MADASEDGHDERLRFRPVPCLGHGHEWDVVISGPNTVWIKPMEAAVPIRSEMWESILRLLYTGLNQYDPTRRPVVGNCGNTVKSRKALTLKRNEVYSGFCQ